MSALVHRVREAASAPQGALVLNHGRGADENDLFSLLDVLDPDRRLVGVTTGAPLTNVPPGGRHWYLVPQVGYPDPETFAASYEALTGFLDGFLAERGLGWESTVIGGFSMGSVMSYAVSLGEGRPTPAGLLVFSGFIPTVDGWSLELEGREGLDIAIHHGANDPIISVDFARKARELLSSGGIEPEYLETDVGHWLPPEAVEPAKRLVAGVASDRTGRSGA
ncbi:MAG TPA: phospholipase [Solirubrobacterales bacterium]|nr:phospholipase [Solirubrobacterales bacterium]